MPPPHASSGMHASLWMKDKPRLIPPLEKNREADVCIVGAGIAGLSIAYALASRGVKVVVLEKNTLGSGETERTTAHLSSALDDGLGHLINVHGKDLAQLAVQSHAQAIDWMEHTIDAEGIIADFARVDGYLFCPPKQSTDPLQEEYEAAKSIGMRGVSMVDKAPLPGFDTGPALRFQNQAQFHPLRYLRGLAEAIVRLGGQIYGDTRVIEVLDDDIPSVRTDSAYQVRARALVIATNAPIADNALLYTKQAPYRTYVVGFRVPKNSIPHALYWDTTDPYHYVRLAPSDDAFDTLIVGGEDHKTGQADDGDARFARLHKWAQKRFPEAKDIAYQWSGQVLDPADGLAMIGKMPGKSKNLFVVTGDSGHGMTHGTIAGMMLPDLIDGKEHSWSEVYNPSRLRLRSLKELATEGANVATQYAEWLAPSDGELGDLEKNEGKVVQDGIAKMAVYRDGTGATHAFSAVCPHRGCIVQWNGTEQSWDCPCHGSRYTALGGVISGPSMSDLHRIAKRQQHGSTRATTAKRKSRR